MKYMLNTPHAASGCGDSSLEVSDFIRTLQESVGGKYTSPLIVSCTVCVQYSILYLIILEHCVCINISTVSILHTMNFIEHNNNNNCS